MQLRRFLVPIDFSEPSRLAFRYAVDLAAQLSADILLVHTWELSAFASPKTELAREMQHDLERDLERFAQSVDTRGVAVRRALLLGPSATEIVSAAEREGADMIVMGSKGRTGLPHVLLGSVAERVLRLAHCPVLTVRAP